MAQEVPRDEQRSKQRIWILATQVRGLRQVLKIPASYVSRVSHAEVLRRSSTCSINEEVLVERLRYLGHLARHPELPPS